MSNGDVVCACGNCVMCDKGPKRRPPATRLWLDIETTGLDPQRDDILEIACALEAPDGELQNVLTTPFPHRLFGLDPVVREMHTKSGLLADCDKGVRKPYQAGADVELPSMYLAENEIIEMVRWYDSVELAGFSVHFDLAFLKVHMPRLAKHLSHRVFDVSTLRTFMREVTGAEPPKGESPHRALEDMLAAYEMYQHYRRTLKHFLGAGQ